MINTTKIFNNIEEIEKYYKIQNKRLGGLRRIRQNESLFNS